MISTKNMVTLDEFLAINAMVRGPHRVLTRIKVAEASATTWHTVGGRGWEDPLFEVISGTVSESREEIGRSLTMSVVSDYWESPYDAIKELSPFKMLISVERGIRTPNLGDIYVPLGVFKIYDLNVLNSASGAVQIDIQAYSREVDVRDARFLKTPVAGEDGVPRDIKGIIQWALGDAFAGTPGFSRSRIGSELDYTFASGTALTEDVERLALINLLEKDRGVWGRFNRKGVYEIVPEPSPIDKAAWTVDAGSDGVLVSVGKNYTREGVYNIVVATAQSTNSDNPGGAMWQHTITVHDDVASSPTYWLGPFGKVPRFWTSSLFSVDPTNNTQIAAAIATLTKGANTMLQNSLAVKAGVNFSVVPNPLLEVGDVVEVIHQPGGDPVLVRRVFHSSSDTTVKELHLIDTLEIGLGADTAMTATTKAKDASILELQEM